MFKKYLEMIADATTAEKLNEIFNGVGGIDEAYQKIRLVGKNTNYYLNL